eukprot:15341053-Ditylum_brightwellii.AAC.1
MGKYEYMRFPLELILEEIKQQYNIQVITHNDHVYVKVCKGMYGLPQAGCIAHDKLVQHLQQHGYAPRKFTPGLWQHEHRDITFCLVVNDVGVKYTKKEDAKHLTVAIQQAYTCTIDWEGKVFCGSTLK